MNCHSLIRAKGSACCLPFAECVYINDSHFCQTICNHLIVILLLLSDPSLIPFLDPSKPNCHLSGDLLNESPHFDLNVDCLSCHFGRWMTASPTRSNLSCLLSDEVRRFVLTCALCKPDCDHGVMYLCFLQLGLHHQRQQLCVSFGQRSVALFGSTEEIIEWTHCCPIEENIEWTLCCLMVGLSFNLSEE